MREFTKSEYEIIQVLWKAGRPLSRADILNLSEGRSWQPSSVHILLNDMLSKELITIAGFSKSGSHYGRTFAPTMTPAEYAARQIRELPSWEDDPAGLIKGVLNELVTKEVADGDEELKQVYAALHPEK